MPRGLVRPFASTLYQKIAESEIISNKKIASPAASIDLPDRIKVFWGTLFYLTHKEVYLIYIYGGKK